MTLNAPERIHDRNRNELTKKKKKNGNGTDENNKQIGDMP